MEPITFFVDNTQVPSLAMDLDGTLSFFTPKYPLIEHVSFWHENILNTCRALGIKTYVFTARSELSQAQTSLNRLGIYEELTTTKPDVDVFIDDRALGAPITENALLRTLSRVFGRDFVSTYLHLLSIRGFKSELGSLAYNHYRVQGDHVDLVLPCGSQGLLLNVPLKFFNEHFQSKVGGLYVAPGDICLTVKAGNEDLLKGFALCLSDMIDVGKGKNLVESNVCLPFRTDAESVDLRKMGVRYHDAI